ncbi:hypothetical protein QWZ16_24850 [Vibrio ostreicida]|uniref:Uncharacterized protein n=1 Tax=Vibrio ostreicida TaxID=526588 RepID=A0ABT8C061_9VIBR|nr:hypothetical protein [Vibrio ostreicida]MDN3612780.1 hypothetical protein [Vibrio ostreicida]
MSEDNVLRAFNCASTDHKKIVEQENLNVVDSVISVDFDNRISARCTLNRNAVCCCESCQVVRQCLNEAYQVSSMRKPKNLYRGLGVAVFQVDSGACHRIKSSAAIKGCHSNTPNASGAFALASAESQQNKASWAIVHAHGGDG